jgi:filamentous hemagglutinin family protein
MSAIGRRDHARASRFGRFDQTIARVLVLSLLAMTPLPVSAGEELVDANNTTFDDATVTLDNSQPGLTTFDIGTNSSTIGWEDLQQPEDNTLTFNLPDSDSIVLNYIGAQHPSNLNGNVMSNGTVAFSNPFGVFIGDTAVVNVGDLIAIGANVTHEDFMSSESMLLSLTGTVENNGLILADRNVALIGSNVTNNGEIIAETGHVLAIAGQYMTLEDWDALTSDFLAPKNFFGLLTDGRVENHGSIAAQSAAIFGGRVVNHGEIEIADHSLLMVGADAVWVTEFDNPVLIKIPNTDQSEGLNDDQAASDASQDAQYAIENHGHIDAGLGHVRLAAADPLGFAIRQGLGRNPEAPASISARRIDLEGGTTGRVHLAGTIDASDLSDEGRGGEIDVTGSIIVLEDASIQASGSLGGGTIHIGGEQEGRGDLQRARAVIVDEDSEVRADATERGDGGTVIVFAEDLTSVDGELSARGGREEGDGGFVETSGLRMFHISRTPDLSAPHGVAGSWLIDPFNITVSNTISSTNPLPPNCPGDGISCFNKAIDAILSPNFDDAGFDGVLRTVNPDDNVPWSNVVSADLIAIALGTGTDVTISTQAFGLDPGTEAGNIDILDAISVDSADILEGTTAKLTFLAAGNINVDNVIEVLPSGGRTNLALSVELRANDAGQVETGQAFETNRLEGDVLINADIRTGGGDVTLTGSSVVQQVGRTIDTDGGDIDIRTGTVNKNGFPVVWVRQPLDPDIDPLTSAPTLEIAGTIDTSNGSEPGGDVLLIASSLNVSTGNDLEVVPGQLSLVQTGAIPTIQTGGGDVTLSGGSPPDSADDNFAGSVVIAGDIDAGDGDVAIISNHVDPDGDTGKFSVTFPNASLGEGGAIDINGNISTAGGTLSIGNARTESIRLDGTFDTTQSDTTENGLVQIVALDLASVDTANSQYGFGEIVIGAVDAAGTTISTSALEIESRDVTFSDGAGVNAVVITASGSSSATLPDASPEDEALEPLSSAEIRIFGERQLVFNQNTEITGEEILIVAAPVPTELNFDESLGINERENSETRLVFGGSNGTGQVAADGVRLNGDLISISVGDGTTSTSNLFSEDEGTSLDPTDFGLQRRSRGSYDGLQLRDTSSVFRPEELGIAQDNDFTITNAPPTSEGELDLGGAFDTALIGSDGMRITLESSDGVLTIEDAAALNNNPIVVPDSDDGKSFVVLNGGLFLPDILSIPTFADDTVVFGDGVLALGQLAGTTAFDVASLTVSTSGNFTVRQQVVESISPAAETDFEDELIFEAGRRTDTEFAAGRGTLTVDGGLTLHADDRLALLAGGSGFGDLAFVGASTTVAANDIELRAGGGLDSENSDINSYSRITGLQTTNLTIRDANGAIFGDLASSATSFEYRQDASIDAETDLPSLSQFGLDPLTGFRATGDVEYGVRSDQSNIDLDDGVVGTNEGDRFRNAALSLIGLDLGLPAIDVSDEFSFIGKKIELGGIIDFTFTQSLASAFNRTGTDADEEMTLRAGVAAPGTLRFNRGNQSSVIAKAPRINLVSGNGIDFEAEFVTESRIDVRGAEFDLAGPVGSVPTFVFHTTSLLTINDLPTKSQFIGDNAGLPDILGIRTDLGLLDFQQFEADQLPIDLTDDPGRRILEADSISLSQTDGDDLELTSTANLNLRLRTNQLTLIASDINVDAADDAQVLIGGRASDVRPLGGVDSDLDNESLFIEAFDSDETNVTIANFSSVSEDPDTPGQFNVIEGRGPKTIVIRQDGAVTPATLFNRDAVSGRLARTLDDDDDGMPIATDYTIQSLVKTASVEPENVNASKLTLSGIAATNNAEGIIFELGTGPAPGVFDFESLFATTESSIVIKNGTQISADDTLSLAAGLLTSIADDPGLIFGGLSFESGGATTSLSGNEVFLTAGPAFELDGPDLDGDGERETIPDALLPQIDFTNLDAIFLNGSTEDSRIDIRQSASLDSNPAGGPGDFITPVLAGLGTDKWENLRLELVQGNLILSDLDSIQTATENLTAVTTNLDASLIVNVPDESVTATPFDDFVGIVEFQSNDMTFASTDPNTSIDLATDKLELVATDLTFGLEPEDELSRLRGDPDVLDRPIVRIHQAADFTDTELPRPEQYFAISPFGERDVRADLTRLDIELKLTTAGSTLTFDNDLRARVSRSNLILDSAGDVEILLDGPTPGFEGLDYAALQLSSLDITTGNDSVGLIGDGLITIPPLTVNGSPEPLTIGTTGDQRFDGTLVLETTLVTEGRDMTFTGDVTQTTTPDAGLRVGTSGAVVFESNIGSSANPLDHLWITFDNSVTTRTPHAQFGRRIDVDGDGILETPLPSDQSVWVLEDILFAAYNFSNGDQWVELENEIGNVSTLSELENFLETLNLGRRFAAGIATIGKALGNLSFNSPNGHFIMASGEKLSVGGTAAVAVDANNGLAALGDVSALQLDVAASDIALVRRDSGVVLDRAGETQQDPGASISANTIDFGTLTPVSIGPGRGTRFGLPNPFDRNNNPAFVGGFPLFELKPSGDLFVAEDFRFEATSGELADQVPSLRPTGSSRSDLSGAFGPKVIPNSGREVPETFELQDSDRLLELDVDAFETPSAIRLARLEGSAIINDLDLPWDDTYVSVTIARLNADFADDAIAVYRELFGSEGERTDEVREILQYALDSYLANTRSRRVVGFELRRFVKNRPSTLLQAYRTLELLDDLFRYHRRLGLSPGEFRRIQHNWLRQIQPDGITLDELGEAIHPSRYVRGSDILDIFGR